MKIGEIVAVALAATFLFAASAQVAIGQNPSAAVQLNSRSETSKTEARYEGSWVTTKTKKLDGTASCQVKQLAKDRWHGRFWGVWQQVPFDYTVEFAMANGEKDSPVTAGGSLVEKPDTKRVRGTATIDGAYYDWVGNLTPTAFDIQFTGSRYHGYLELKRVADNKPQR
jgi:hypothetical protein